MDTRTAWAEKALRNGRSSARWDSPLLKVTAAGGSFGDTMIAVKISYMRVKISQFIYQMQAVRHLTEKPVRRISRSLPPPSASPRAATCPHLLYLHGPAAYPLRQL